MGKKEKKITMLKLLALVAAAQASVLTPMQALVPKRGVMDHSCTHHRAGAGSIRVVMFPLQARGHFSFRTNPEDEYSGDASICNLDKGLATVQLKGDGKWLAPKVCYNETCKSAYLVEVEPDHTAVLMINATKNTDCNVVCMDDNGGCDSHATCKPAAGCKTYREGNKAVCTCNKGWVGSGTTCHQLEFECPDGFVKEGQECKRIESGSGSGPEGCKPGSFNVCDKNALCTDDETKDPSQVNIIQCTCNRGFVGNGVKCNPDAMKLD